MNLALPIKPILFSLATACTFSPSLRGRGRGPRRGRGGRSSLHPFTNINDTAKYVTKLATRACVAIFILTRVIKPPPPNLSANLTTTAPHMSSTQSHAWFPDTAATNPFTNDFQNLNLTLYLIRAQIKSVSDIALLFPFSILVLSFCMFPL